MRNLIIEYGPWVLSCFSLVMIYLTGERWRYVWIYSFVVQLLWLTWILTSDNLGFLPITCGYMILAVINHRKWNKKVVNG